MTGFMGADIPPSSPPSSASTRRFRTSPRRTRAASSSCTPRRICFGGPDGSPGRRGVRTRGEGLRWRSRCRWIIREYGTSSSAAPASGRAMITAEKKTPLLTAGLLHSFSAPKMRFKTKVYHCNVNADGNICLDVGAYCCDHQRWQTQAYICDSRPSPSSLTASPSASLGFPPSRPSNPSGPPPSPSSKSCSPSRPCSPTRTRRTHSIRPSQPSSGGIAQSTTVSRASGRGSMRSRPRGAGPGSASRPAGTGSRAGAEAEAAAARGRSSRAWRAAQREAERRAARPPARRGRNPALQLRTAGARASPSSSPTTRIRRADALGRSTATRARTQGTLQRRMERWAGTGSGGVRATAGSVRGLARELSRSSWIKATNATRQSWHAAARHDTLQVGSHAARVLIPPRTSFSKHRPLPPTPPTSLQDITFDDL